MQTRCNTIYACEIKFSKSLVKRSVLDEVEQKLSRLQLPRQLSVRPALIHVNGAHRDVIDSRIFPQLIDFGELLTM